MAEATDWRLKRVANFTEKNKYVLKYADRFILTECAEYMR